MTPDTPFTEEQRVAAEKIAKLLQLGHKNPNQSEAAAALEKASAMALAFNLDIAAIGATSDKGARKQEKVRGGFYDHQVWIWQEVAKLNFCLYFRDGEWVTIKRRHGWKNSDGTWATWDQEVWTRYHGLVGRQHNVATTRSMATYLEQAVERLVMERLGNDNTQRWSRWAVSFRKGAVLDICDRLRERRQEAIDEEERQAREAEKRAAEASMAGASASTAITIASLQQSEADANMDEYLERAPGTTARLRAERKAQQAAKAEARRQADEEYTRWAAAHREEAAAQEKERRKEAEKAEARANRSRSKRDPYWDNVDWGAYRAGKEVGSKIGLDVQQDTGVGKGKGLGHG